MPVSLFAADLHLSEDHPETVALFRRFLEGPAREADDVYLLGDLFEAWVGDDSLDLPFNREVAALLAACARNGPRLWLMHGNRDFLMGERLADACDARLLREPAVVCPDGEPTLLLHGDVLCTDDTAYQQFRAQVRAPAWQQAFLARPLEARLALVAGLRQDSERAKQGKDEAIMDVADAAVRAALAAVGCHRLVHGHTHRPAGHVLEVDGQRAERWVVPAWYQRGGWLRIDAAGCALHWLPPAGA